MDTPTWFPACALTLVHQVCIQAVCPEVGNYMRNLGVSIIVHYHSVREVCTQAFLATAILSI